MHVSKQRPGRRFSVVKYSLAALRYLVTGFLALFLALVLILLLVEAAAAIGAPLERADEDLPAFGNSGGSVAGASPQRSAVFWRAGVEVSFVHDRADFGTATLHSSATTRSARPSVSIVVRF